MPPETQPQVDMKPTETLLEHNLVNGNDNAQKTHSLLEHHLVNGDANAKTSHTLAEHQLVMQGEIVKELHDLNSQPKVTEMSDKVDIVLKAMRGEKGDKGDVGEKGERGDKGETGEKGDKGQDSNVAGPKGDKGDRGMIGINGVDGKDGFNGKNGKDGKNGRDGKDGKDGSILSGEEIAKKIKGVLKYDDLKNAPQFPRLAGTGYLRELSDVSIQGIAVGQSIQWDGVRWIPFTPATGGTPAFGEVPTGSGISFTLANTPTTGTVRLYRGGAYQQSGIGKDYTISGLNITLAVTLAPGETLLADYNH